METKAAPDILCNFFIQVIDSYLTIILIAVHCLQYTLYGNPLPNFLNNHGFEICSFLFVSSYASCDT